MSRRSFVTIWCLSAIVAGCAVLALALVLGGGAPPPAPPGLPDDARLPAWIGAVVSYGVLLVAVIAVGLGLLGCGALDRERPDMRSAAAAAATLWTSATLLQLGLLSWELGGGSEVFGSDRLRALVAQLVLVVVATGCWTFGRRRAAAIVGTMVAVAAVLPLVIVGHPASADHPVVTTLSVSAHVVGAVTWVGGLAALGWLAVREEPDWSGALPRYSRLAFASVVVLIVCGVVSALGRLTRPADLLTSGYGAILLLKVVLVCGLVAAGWLQREYVVHRVPVSRRHFVAVASMELTTMTLALALAVALARTPPPG